MKLKNRIEYVLKHINSIGVLATCSYFFQRFFKGKNTLIRIECNNIKFPIYLRNKSYDINIFYQIFIAKDLEFKIQSKINSIIDLGANIGLSSIFLINKFPNSKIVSVEPDPENYKLLEKNIAPYQSITPIRAAVYSKDCEMPLVDIGEGEASYQIIDSTKVNDSKGYRKIVSKVNCFSMNSLMKRFLLETVDFVKMDIEGAEEDCIFQSDEWIESITYLAVEIHESIKPGLTNRIKKVMSDRFYYYSHGEYHVFQNKLI